jgi:hypothetical protein
VIAAGHGGCLVPAASRQTGLVGQPSHVGARDASPTRTVSALGVYCQRLYIAGDRLLELEGDRVRAWALSQYSVRPNPYHK